MSLWVFLKDETTCESCWRAVPNFPAKTCKHKSFGDYIITCFFLDKKYQPQKFATLQLAGWSVALLAPAKAPCWKRWRGQDQHSLATALVGEVGWQEGGKPRRQRMEVVIDDCWEFLAGPSSFVWKMMKKGTWRWKCLFVHPCLRCAKVNYDHFLILLEMMEVAFKTWSFSGKVLNT